MRHLILSLFWLAFLVPTSHAASGGSYSPSPAVKGIAREVYIAMRTDGAAGKGTFDDPFDGSTAAKFDVAFSNAVSASAVVHLGPGTFTTAGKAFPAFSFPLVGGAWKIEGAGVGVTTLKLADGTVTANGANHDVIGEHADGVPAGQTPEYIEISHLTVDANSANQPAVTNGLDLTLSCIEVSGRHVYLHDLHAKGAYGKTYEANTLSVAAPAVPDAWHLIERCRVTDVTGWMTAINILGTADTNQASGLIKDCLVVGDGTTIAGSGQVAFGGWRMTGVRFQDNFASGVVAGFICDTASNTNLVYQGNRVAAPYGWGIIINGSGTYDGVEIFGNWFGASASSTAILTAASPPADLRVWGNRFDSTAQGITDLQATAGLFETSQLLRGADGRMGIKSGATVTNASFHGATTNTGYGLLSMSVNTNGTASNQVWTVSFFNDVMDFNTRVAPSSNDVGYLRILRAAGEASGAVWYVPVTFSDGLKDATLSPSTLIYADTDGSHKSATVGTGLTFSGGTLSATGGSTLTNTFNEDQFALVNGTNVNVKTNPLLTNAFSQGWLLIGETNFTPGATEGLMVQDNARAAVRMKNTSASGRDVKLESGTTGQAAVALYDFTMGGAALISFSENGTFSLRNNSGIPAGLTDNGMILGDSASNPTANPTNSAVIWSGSSDGIKYRTATASEGAGANNRVHNRAAIHQPYHLTNSNGIYIPAAYTNMVYTGTGPLMITLPTAGTYALESQLGIYDDSTAGLIQFYARLWSSNAAVQEVVGQSEIYADLLGGAGNHFMQHISTLYTVTNATDVYVQCQDPVNGTASILQTNYTSLRYIRLY